MMMMMMMSARLLDDTCPMMKAIRFALCNERFSHECSTTALKKGFADSLHLSIGREERDEHEPFKALSLPLRSAMFPVNDRGPFSQKKIDPRVF